MTRYCLDTSAYSRFMLGDPAVVDVLATSEWIGMPAITLGELRTGFLLGDRRGQNEAELQDFLAHPIVTVLPVDSDASWHFAEIVVDLRKAGSPLPTNEIWIAAIAARAGALVLTYDRHFEKIVRVGSRILG